jgi:hypothetical protein
VGSKAAIALVAAGAVTLVVVAGESRTGDEAAEPPRAARSQPDHAARPPRRVRARRLLARAPALGVSCRVPDSIRCDQVGLAVWLRRSATPVRVWAGDSTAVVRVALQPGWG